MDEIISVKKEFNSEEAVINAIKELKKLIIDLETKKIEHCTIIVINQIKHDLALSTHTEIIGINSYIPVPLLPAVIKDIIKD